MSNNEPAAVPKSPAIKGSASVSAAPPQLAPALAEWSVDPETKSATAEILGGTAVISRSPKNNSFQCEYRRDFTQDSDEGEQTGSLQMNFPLNDATNLKMAQLRTETLIRETLNKTHPQVLAAAMVTESQSVADASDGKDPF